MRTHLACPKRFVTSFGNEIEESAPSAASAEAYRAQALTPTVLHATSSDLLPRDSNDFGFESSEEGRTSGAVRTVEAEPEFGTPSCQPPRAGYHCSAADGCSDRCQAGQVRSRRQPVHGFEPGQPFGTRTATKKIFHFFLLQLFLEGVNRTCPIRLCCSVKTLARKSPISTSSPTRGHRFNRCTIYPPIVSTPSAFNSPIGSRS